MIPKTASILLVVGLLASAAEAQQQTVGLLQNDEGAFTGYTLFKRGGLDTTYLIDNEGSVVHSWTVGDGLVAYLLEDGNLLEGPRDVVEYAWDGTVVWQYSYSTSHHDLTRLPNGNTLLIARETIAGADAIAAGRDPALLDANLRPLHIIEVQKTGPTSGTIVWEWRAWDHLIQDFDPTKPNYGVVADHPELIDLNFAADGGSDWLHANAIDYNPGLDQIVVSLRNIDEIWVIDHSTTTAEAASHSGGNAGRGGDLLYRWGNPRAYDRGDTADQQLFGQHDANWIDAGLPGAGNILVFNNGLGRLAGVYSSADEIVPPVSGFVYPIGAGSPYDPPTPLAVFTADPPTSMYSTFYSSSQRLPNGNTLMDAGSNGTFVEVDAGGATVWKYVNPRISTGPLTQGDPIPLAASGPGFDNRVFKVRRYAPDYPGLAGRNLTPTAPIEVYTATAALTLQSTAGGSVADPGEGTYPFGVGRLVTGRAVAEPCYVFAGWSVETGSAVVDDPGSAHATFTMEPQDTTLLASFSVDPDCDPDDDDDGIPDVDDNCPQVANPGQADADDDLVGDACDNCVDDPNAGQDDADADGTGDACDPCPNDPANDADGDGVCESTDNCPVTANPGQEDDDEDGRGDACDPCPFDVPDDADGDGVCETDDNCDLDFNPSQIDTDSDGLGDVCDDDDDGDGVPDGTDNCPLISNPDQADGNGNGVGTLCDPVCELVIGASGPPGADFPTLLSALNSPVVKNGCVLLVEPGTYNDPLVVDRYVTMIAMDGDPQSTILDAGGAAVAIDVPDLAGSGRTRIRGFTVRNATDAVVSLESLTLESCVIEGGAGAAVDLGAGVHELTNVSIRGGVSGVVLSGTATVLNSVIAGHAATAVHVQPGGDLRLTHVTVAGNGVGLEAPSATVVVEHSILCGNTIDVSGVPCSAISFSDICDTDCTGLGTLDCTGADGNVSVDPQFASPGADDYRLTPSSPAVDAGMAPECFTGDPCRDLEGTLRLQDADGDGDPRPDMGAYELDHLPAAIPEPGEVTGLGIAFEAGVGHVLGWNPEPSASLYHVYEGLLSDLAGAHALVCLATVSAPSLTLPASNPPSGAAFVYAVSGDDTVEEGTLGYGTCAERSNAVDPCP